ncbi:MAG: hypothetical protein ACRDJH_12870 [Thermomicrobiales bacterium]
MSKVQLPKSRLVGDMIEQPTPCGLHVEYYPASLGLLAFHLKQCSVFHTMCECGIAYLVATQPDGTHFRMEGPPMVIMDRYESIPWKEQSITDSNDTFFYRMAPSLAELHECFDSIARKGH